MDRAFTVFGERLVLAVEQTAEHLRVRIGAEVVEIEDHWIDDRYVTMRIGPRLVRVPYARAGAHVHVARAGESYEFVPAEEAEDAAREAGAFTPEVTSPMPGKVLAVKAAVGDVVEADQPLLLLEAMKMEQTVRASARARVVEIRVEAGSMVGPGAVLMKLELVEEQAPGAN
jgi:acetyl-CoA/propionyl-CoA carboxylase, biotin carboxylase, biotin carboxyl carrier protein